MTWPFLCFGEWSLWAVLALLVVWDLAAVLLPCGVLRLTMELMQERARAGEPYGFPAGVMYESSAYMLGLGDFIFFSCACLPLARRHSHCLTCPLLATASALRSGLPAGHRPPAMLHHCSGCRCGQHSHHYASWPSSRCAGPARLAGAGHHRVLCGHFLHCNLCAEGRGGSASLVMKECGGWEPCVASMTSHSSGAVARLCSVPAAAVLPVQGLQRRAARMKAGGPGHGRVRRGKL